MKKTSIKIDGKNYTALNMRLSSKVAEAMRVVRKHFRLLTLNGEISEEVARYEGWWDFASVAVRLVLRLDAYLDYRRSISIGSGYISEKPWLSFGEIHGYSEYKLNNFYELIDKYDEQLSHEYACFYDVPYNSDIISLISLSNKYEISADNMLGVCLLFARDLIYHCGPDCDMFFDLFTNDGRDNPETTDLDLWEINRIRLWGRFGALKSRNSSYSQREYDTCEYVYYKPKKLKLKKCEVSFELISTNEIIKDVVLHKVEI